MSETEEEASVRSRESVDSLRTMGTRRAPGVKHRGNKLRARGLGVSGHWRASENGFMQVW